MTHLAARQTITPGRDPSAPDAMILQTPLPIDIIVTTYASDTLYTQACLEAIAAWKRPHHNLIVVTHDESALLRAFLEAEAAGPTPLIDDLVLAVPGHGHTRSFNLGVTRSNADVVFNIANDICIGPTIVDDCAWRLRKDRSLGMIGWHWYNEGTFWKDGELEGYQLRDNHKQQLEPEQRAAIENSTWFTGRVFQALGTKWLCLCNTAFFGARRDTLNLVGGGFGPQYSHYWADDLLNYAVLDQGLDVSNFDRRFRAKPYFHEFQYSNVDVQDRRRHENSLNLAHVPALALAHSLAGGMSPLELATVYLTAAALSPRATLSAIGVWRGGSVVAMLEGLKGKPATIEVIDCFDLPGISSMSAQPPIAIEEFSRHISPYIEPHHHIKILKANTLDMQSFPKADLVVLDAGHTTECIRHDAPLVKASLRPNGVALFHDYGQPSWPAVGPTITEIFGQLPAHETLAVYRSKPENREAFHWSRSNP